MTKFMLHKNAMDVCFEPVRIVPGVSHLLVRGRWLNMGFEGVPQYISHVEDINIASSDWNNWQFLTEEELCKLSATRGRNNE